MNLATNPLMNLVLGWKAHWRNRRRVTVRLPVKLAIIEPGRKLQGQPINVSKSRAISACTRDISPTGLALESSVMRIDRFHIARSEDMAADQILDLEVTLPSRTIRLEGKPVRYEKPSASGNYIIGVAISRMSAEDRRAYTDLIEMLSTGNYETAAQASLDPAGGSLALD